MHIDTLASAAVSAGFAKRGIDGRESAAVFCIQLRAFADKVLHDVVPAPECCAMQERCAALRIGRIHVTAGFEKQIERSNRALLNIFGCEPATRVGIYRSDAG